MTRDEILNAYLADPNPRHSIPLFIQRTVDLMKTGKITEGIDLMNIGHMVLVRSGVRPEANPYVDVGTQAAIYCWVCDKFMATPDARTMVARCKHCKKSFCPSHAERKPFGVVICPLCKLPA